MAHKKNGKSKANNQRIIKLPPCNRKLMSIFQPQLGSSKKQQQQKHQTLETRQSQKL